MGFQPAGVKEFIKLEDTPASYSGQTGKVAQVKAGENGVEFQAPAESTIRIRKDFGAVIGTRPQINLRTGVGVGLIVEDNPPDDEVDIMYSSATPHKHMILLPEDAVLPGAGAPAKATVDGANFSYEVLDYDQDAEEKAYWERWLSPDYNEENIIIDIYWIATPAAGDVKWGAQVLGRAKGETWDSALGTEQTVVTPTGGAGLLNLSTITTFNPVWEGEDTLLFKIARKAADGADTLLADARIVKVVVSYTMSFKQSFYPMPVPVPLDETNWVNNVYYTVDAKDYGVPHGATGVVLIAKNDPSFGQFVFARKKGSTDDFQHLGASNCQCHLFVGLDHHDEFEVKTSNKQYVDVWVIAYCGTGVVFFDNAKEKTVGSDDSWLDVDLSGDCPNAIGVIIEFNNTGGAMAWSTGARKNGSTSDYTGAQRLTDMNPMIVGVDGGQIMEYRAAELRVRVFKVVGYILSGCQFLTQKVDKTPVETGVWEEADFSGYPKSTIAFLEFCHAMVNDSAGARKSTSGGIYQDCHHGILLAILDQNSKCYLIRQYNAPFPIKMYLVGYATHAG